MRRLRTGQDAVILVRASLGRGLTAQERRQLARMAETLDDGVHEAGIANIPQPAQSCWLLESEAKQSAVE